MANIKDQRAAGIMLELAAKYIALEAGRGTLITPLRVDVSRDRKHLTIFVSVYPQEQGAQAIAFLMRHKDLFRNYLKKHSRFAVLPYVTFEIDYGEINRQQVEEVSRGVVIPEESEEESAAE